MPTQSGAQPVAGQDMMDAGNGVAATKYSDGSVVFWQIAPPHEQVGYLPPGGENPVDIGGGKAATLGPDGSLLVFDIANPPPEVAGTIPSDAPPGAVPEPPRPPGFPTGPVGTRKPGEDFNYGITRPGAGRYPTSMPGQRTPGRPTDIPFGSTVAPSTWNPADPSQGRSEGWGSIGAGTAGVNYGWGVPGFGKDPIKINEDYLDNLFDPKQAPGYIAGSGTYNQFLLNQGGLFGQLPGQQGEVNLRYGLGGTGDPTTGREAQTPMRWVTGNASDPLTSEPNDDAWRRRTGQMGGGGGGGFDPSFAFQGTPAYQYPQQQPMQQSTPSRGAAVPYGTGGGGGMGGGFFTAGPGYSPEEQGNLWGQGKTAGIDSLVTLFMRSDTPTGISTAAWSAPDQYWQLLLQAIRDGKVVVSDPQGWAMLRQKNPAYTPQNIGGAALTGASGASAGGTGGTGGTGSTEDAIANGNAAEAADRAAYWAYQQAMVRQGDEGLALEAARDAWTKTYQQTQLDQDRAKLTGTFEGNPTLDAAKQRWLEQYQTAGLTGTFNGAPTMDAINQQNTAALGLLQTQASLQGPRNWDRYQSTFNATPGGLRDVMAAFSGRYALPGAAGAQATAQGGRQSVAGLSGDILSGTYGNDPTQQPEAVGNPYQADVRNWSRMTPSQREMILGKYENQGWYGQDVTDMLASVAPKYAGATGGSYSLFK